MKNEVATKEATKFDLVSGYEGMSDEDRAEFEDEFSDLDDGTTGIMARHIKVPSGGGKAFEIEGDTEDDTEVVKEVQGVIIFTHRMNAYWPSSFGQGEAGTNTPPECSSMDAKKGYNYKTGKTTDCDTCPFNQFGEGGKPCKNLRRIYLMRNGSPNVYLLSVPPTSMKDVSRGLARIMGNGKVPYTKMVVSFKLVPATSKGGINYSKIAISKVGDLTPEQGKQVSEIRKQVKEQYESVQITAADYNTEPDNDSAPASDNTQAQAAPDGFMNIPDIPEEELPFK